MLSSRPSSFLRSSSNRHPFRQISSSTLPLLSSSSPQTQQIQPNNTASNAPNNKTRVMQYARKNLSDILGSSTSYSLTNTPAAVPSTPSLTSSIVQNKLLLPVSTPTSPVYNHTSHAHVFTNEYDSYPSHITPPTHHSPANHAPINNLYDLQIWHETEVQQAAADEYKKILTLAVGRSDSSSLKDVQVEFSNWFGPLAARIELEQAAVQDTRKPPSIDETNYGPLLLLLPADKLAVITMHEVVNMSLNKGNQGTTIAMLSIRVGDAVRAEINLQKLLSKQKMEPYPSTLLNSLKTLGSQKVARINRRAMILLEEPDWDVDLKCKLGAALMQMLLDSAVQADGSPSFIYEKRRENFTRVVGYIRCSAPVYDRLVGSKFSGACHYRHQPMVVPPKLWTSPSEGGYLGHQTQIMRTHGCKLQLAALEKGDLSKVYEGLNALGKVGWRINTGLLGIIDEAWDRGMVLAELPSRVDYDKIESEPRPIPPAVTSDNKPDPSHPLYPEFKDSLKAWGNHQRKLRKVLQKNSDLHSLRCDILIKLETAKKFKDYEIFFPYNVDFRGRAYPIPPNLNHLGSDLCRSLLTFSKAKKLGPKGLYWMKVNCANLFGKNKISMDERAKFIDDNWSALSASALDPLGPSPESKFWLEADEPWQALACIREIKKAVDSGDAENYVSQMFVSMDGSCNGLQHYAALGRDKEGGSAVNLTPNAQPQDVYMGVCDKVVKRIEAECAKVLDPATASREALRDHACAHLVLGLIDRKVVKQTVMTSVYGVTYIGARMQIQNRLEEKFAQARGLQPDEMETELYQAACYVSTLTLATLDELFSGARQIMSWLGECSRIVATQGQPMSWTTPLGLPCSQPYRKTGKRVVRTLMQNVLLVDDRDDLPVNVMKQKSAFAPNFVHSFDSTHMLMTAIEMEKRGLPFSAVHDSYWCHPSDTDEMNEILRDEFVKLYEKPLLKELKRSLEVRFPGIHFPEIPVTGTLDLNDVKKSTYFFQ